MAYTLGQLAKHVGGKIVGDSKCTIDSVATLQSASKGQISFLTNLHYKPYLESTNASAVILLEEHASQCPVNALLVSNPHAAYAKVAQLLYSNPLAEFKIDSTASIADSSQIHQNCYIAQNVVIEDGVIIDEGVYLGANTVIGKNSHIGKDSHLHANVTVCRGSQIGERALFHPGVVIGSDGFGQANEDGVWLKVPQLGGVVIGNDVEIGANTTVDCGAIEDTIIEDGVKLDNLIQIGHNVRIGAHTVMAACAAVAGSTKIGKHCMIGGAVGIAGHLEIADNVMITGMSFVCKSISKPGSFSSAIPSENSQQWHRLVARIKQLDDMAKRLRRLEKKLD